MEREWLFDDEHRCFTGGLPENYGGVGGDFRYAAIFAEEMARSKSGGIFAGLGLHGCVVLPALNAFGNEAQKEKYLVAGIEGGKIGALAVTEPDTGSDVAGIRTKAVEIADMCIQIHGDMVT